MIMANTVIDYSALWGKIGEWGRKAGRASTRPVLLLYYVMTSKDTPRKDKWAIFASIAYLVLPIDVLSARRLPVIGWLDEVVSLGVMIQKMQQRVTPEMQRRADETLDRWFPEYTEFEEIPLTVES